MIDGLFGVRFLFSDTKRERCSIDDYSSILQRPLFIYLILLISVFITRIPLIISSGIPGLMPLSQYRQHDFDLQADNSDDSDVPYR